MEKQGENGDAIQASGDTADKRWAVTDLSSVRVGFLEKLSREVRAKVSPLAQLFHYPPGKQIFQQGDPSGFLFVVNRGHVALEATAASGSRLTLLTVEPPRRRSRAPRRSQAAFH